jgi:hypothetical protein
MKSRLISFILSFASFLSACEEVVHIKPNKADMQLVVEGLIVTDPGKSYVKLTETTPYFSSTFSKAKSGANVFVKDNSGHEVNFIETSEGLYSCPPDFEGKIGSSYILQIKIDGTEITANSTIQAPVKSVSARVVYINDSDPELRKGYYLYGIFSDEKNVKNYYRAEVFVNGVRQLRRANDIIVFDDRFFENQDNIEGQFGYWANNEDDVYKLKAGDEVSLKLYSIDYSTYNFLKALSETPSQGGLFGKNPANVPSNVTGALGIFQASSYAASDKLTVLEK